MTWQEFAKIMGRITTDNDIDDTTARHYVRIIHRFRDAFAGQPDFPSDEDFFLLCDPQRKVL